MCYKKHTPEEFLKKKKKKKKLELSQTTEHSI